MANRTIQEHLEVAAEGAAAIVAIGSCASWGGIPSSGPNPTGAVGVAEVLPGKTIVNIPGCPPNPYNFLSTELQFVAFGSLPALDEKGRPKCAYGRLIHENSERRPHFDAGRFATEFGDDNHRRGYCLYKLGCKGPATFANCSIVRFNDAGVWPVSVGHPCIGCTEPKVLFRMPMFENVQVPNPTPPDTYPSTIVSEKGHGADPLTTGVVGLVAGAVLGGGAILARNSDDSNEGHREACLPVHRGKSEGARAACDGVSAFLDLELRDAKKALEAQEQAISQYKSKHIGLLPEQMDANLRSLDRSQAELNATDELIHSLTDKVGLVEKSIKEYEASGVTQGASGTTAAGHAGMGPLIGRLRELERDLSSLVAGEYTETYPDMVVTKKEIEGVKKKLVEKYGDPAKEKDGDAARTFYPYLRELIKQRNELRVEVSSVKDRRRRLAEHIREFEQRVEQTPSREQDLMILMRDYENMQKNYQARAFAYSGWKIDDVEFWGR